MRTISSRSLRGVFTALAAASVALAGCGMFSVAGAQQPPHPGTATRPAVKNCEFKDAVEDEEHLRGACQVGDIISVAGLSVSEMVIIGRLCDMAKPVIVVPDARQRLGSSPGIFICTLAPPRETVGFDQQGRVKYRLNTQQP